MQNQQQILKNLQPVDLDAGKIFSGKSSGTKVKGYAKPSAYTPAIDQSYVFHEYSRDVAVWFIDSREPLYVFGPTGCGKTSCIKQMAARLNYPVFEVTGHGRLEFADLLGHLTIRDGSMCFEYGPLALAMRYGGLLLLNEIDLISPEVAAGLNSVLDGSPLCIAENGGELITLHAMFRFAATANTNGGGDETGLYQGAVRQNLAFSDRFMLCEMGYPNREIEEGLLREHCPSLPDELCKKMVSYAHEVRGLFMGESSSSSITNSIEVTFSTRSLLRWGNLTVRYQALAKQGIQPITYALDRALAFRASRESRAMLHELAQRMFATGSVAYATPLKKDTRTLSGEAALSVIQKHCTLAAKLPCVVYLRNIGKSGQPKFWRAECRPNGISLKWGRVSSAGQARLLLLGQDFQGEPISELAARATAKINEGYSLIMDKCSF